MIEEDKLNALELFGENEYLHKEIERLQEHNIQLMKREELNCKIIKKYQNIMKEVREWLEEDYEHTIKNEICDNPRYYLDKFLEILDKGE